jgi:hypothetical protein
MRFLKRLQIPFFLVSCLSLVGLAACGHPDGAHPAAPSQAFSPTTAYWTPPEQTEPAKIAVPAIADTTLPRPMTLRSRDGTVAAVYAIPDGWHATSSGSADKVSLKASYDYSGATCLLDTYDPARTLAQYTAVDKAAVTADLLNTWENIKAEDVHFPKEKTEGFVVSYSDADDDKRSP